MRRVLAAWAIVGALLMWCPEAALADTITVDYRTADQTEAATVTLGGITVTGSDSISISSGGLGVVAGYFDQIIDSGETATFAFGSRGATSVSALLSPKDEWLPSGDANGDSIAYQFSVEAFDADASSLGTIDLSESDFGGALVPGSHAVALDISALFDDAAISSFTFDTTDGFAVHSITYAQPVPEPSTLVLLSFVGGAAIAWRRRRRAADRLDV